MTYCITFQWVGAEPAHVIRSSERKAKEYVKRLRALGRPLVFGPYVAECGV